MNPADRLLLRLIGQGPADLGELGDGMAASDGWARLVERARAHGVAPLVAHELAGRGWAGVPRPVRDALEAARRANAARNLLAARALARLLDHLAAAGVRVMPLKGVALAERLYGDRSLRVAADIDILVPRADVARAWAAMRAAGYAPAPQESPVDEAELDLLVESNMEYAFAGPDAPGAVELHWDIAWRWLRRDQAVADLWARAVFRPFDGRPAWAPSPEWELLYLAVHAARHRWHTLKWLVDLHQLCRGGAMDCAAVDRAAARFGLERVLAISLGACRALFDTPVPGGRAAAVPEWLSLFPAEPAPADVWHQAAYPARLFRRRTDQLAYLARVLLRPTLAEHRALGLPRSLRGLYYPLRPLRLAARWAAGRRVFPRGSDRAPMERA